MNVDNIKQKNLNLALENICMFVCLCDHAGTYICLSVCAHKEANSSVTEIRSQGYFLKQNVFSEMSEHTAK